MSIERSVLETRAPELSSPRLDHLFVAGVGGIGAILLTGMAFGHSIVILALSMLMFIAIGDSTGIRRGVAGNSLVYTASVLRSFFWSLFVAALVLVTLLPAGAAMLCVACWGIASAAGMSLLSRTIDEGRDSMTWSTINVEPETVSTMIEGKITRSTTSSDYPDIAVISVDTPSDVPQSPMGPVGFAVKRTLDLVFATVALVLSLPIFAVLGILIPLTSPGKVIFKQQRVGKNGKLFTMYKFRTMNSFITDGVCPKDPSDPRITPLGRILRKTSIDEIPQFFNVLKGDMSIVGPRPEMKFIVDRYTSEQRKRLVATPGITGLWQLSPYRNRPIHDHVEYDLEYISNQSILLDVVVMMRTVLWAWRGV